MSSSPQTPVATAPDAPPVPTITRVRGALGVVAGALLALACATALVFMLQDRMTSTGADKPDGLLVVQAGYAMLYGVVIAMAGVQMFRKGGISKGFGLVLFAMTIVFVSLGWLWQMF